MRAPVVLIVGTSRITSASRVVLTFGAFAFVDLRLLRRASSARFGVGFVAEIRRFGSGARTLGTLSLPTDWIRAASMNADRGLVGAAGIMKGSTSAVCPLDGSAGVPAST